jgi:hypothetical protein
MYFAIYYSKIHADNGKYRLNTLYEIMVVINLTESLETTGY